MRRYIGLCGLLLSTVFVFASCLKDDEEETTLYDDTALTSFAITTAKILTHTTSSTGEDSTYYTTSTSLSYYPFSIDHINGLIYNVDSLPLGTDPTKMLVSYATKNNGLAWIENLAGDSVKYLQSTDSTDFSTPRKVRVYASNGSQNYKSYTVKVNIHQEDGDEFVWSEPSTVAAFAALKGMKLVCLGDNVLLLGTDGTATTAYAAKVGDVSTWNKVDATLGKDAYKNAVAKGDTLYVLDGTDLKAKAEGKGFATVATTTAISQLIGATKTEMYGYSASGELMVSRDNGLTWEADLIDASASYLPTDGLAFSSSAFAYADSTDLALLAGSRALDGYASDAQAVVWRKVVEYASIKEQTEWNYIDFANGGSYPLPRLSGLTVLPYGDVFIAFGGEGIGACTASPFANVYESRDGGLTWKATSTYALPEGFAKENGTTFAATVDGANHIWLVRGGTGEVWSGRLNKLGWK